MTLFPILAEASFGPQLELLIVLGVLSAVILRRVPLVVCVLVAFFVVVALFPDQPFTEHLGGLVAGVLGPLLAIGLIVLGFRIMLGGHRHRCSRCGCCHCRCHDARFF